MDQNAKILLFSLSLGTYSIGLMQSSSVKSEMYPIWAVSLLTLFGCVDPITSYIGLDYKGPLFKMIFQLCLYCGYVLLMSVPIISGVVGNLAIGLLSAITVIKGLHRSLALVLPSRIREQLEGLASTEPDALAGDGEGLMVHLPIPRVKRREEGTVKWDSKTTMSDIRSSCNDMLGEPWLGVTAKDKEVLEDVCLGSSLSLLLRRRFLGLDTTREMDGRKFEGLVGAGRAIDYKRAFKVIEIELAFLYEVFFTSNEFLHFYEAKTSSFWALASFISICFVGVAVSIIPAGTMAAGSNVVVVHTTATDVVMTRAILVSLALVQFVQLIRCWASNWARVAFACDHAATRPKAIVVTLAVSVFSVGMTDVIEVVRSSWWPWMRLRAFVITRINRFDKWLWQDKLGQYSVHQAAEMRCRVPLIMCKGVQIMHLCCWFCGLLMCLRPCAFCLRWIRDRLPRLLGSRYIRQVLRELLGSGGTSTSAPVGLHDDVKASILDFLGKIKSRRIGKEWWSSLVVGNNREADILLQHLPYSSATLRLVDGTAMSDAYAFTHRVMVWHIATCYCEAAERKGEGGSRGFREKNQRVAILVSKYCAYLLVSAPELLPGPSEETKRASLSLRRLAEDVIHEEDLFFSAGDRGALTRRNLVLEAMEQRSSSGDGDEVPTDQGNPLEMGVYLGKLLLRRNNNDPWEVLALLWVQTLLYAAPYGDAEAHMKHLSQGGELITHLWALLYHLGIDKWEKPGEEPGAAGGTKEETTKRPKAGGETTTSLSGGCDDGAKRLTRARSVPADLGSTLQAPLYK